MTDANLMDADCIHGKTWWACDECTAQDDAELRAVRERADKVIEAHREFVRTTEAAIIDLWDHIGPLEVFDLQPETVELCQLLHERREHE